MTTTVLQPPPPSTTAGPLAAIIDRLACAECRGALARHDGESLLCGACGARYPIVDGIPDLRPPAWRDKQEFQDWTKHWSDDKQRSLHQRFFSFYRKAVFAKAIRHFVHKYLPADGLLLEAGSGTSETSMLIDKHGGRRTLVALDLIHPVLRRCHPNMDHRVQADIFRLPFKDDSIDGIWNVGVMEHFLHDRIDEMMREFHRVLKPGARLVLFWPGRTSIPQKMLRCAEFFINLRRRRDDRFQFHPDEISQLKSAREGRDVLRRNGFTALEVNGGWRSLMAFKIPVGEKA